MSMQGDKYNRETTLAPPRKHYSADHDPAMSHSTTVATHARLSPSGASRWLACPGSVVLEESYPDNGSSYAREGTAAHTLAAMVLNTPGINTSDFLGERIRVEEDSFTVTKDMARYVQSYVDYVREAAEGKMLFIEVAVPIGHLTGEEGATGTADAIIADVHARSLTVIDLKYGAGVAVDAEDNEQLQMYALGALEETDMLAEFGEVTMVIHQPRVREYPSEWTVERDVLRQFAEVVTAGADTVAAAAQRRDPSSDAWVETYLHPGEKPCKFCKVPKHECPAYRNEMLSVIGAPAATAEDFAALAIEPADDKTGDNWLSAIFPKIGMLEGLAKSVRAEVERRCLAGGGAWGEFKLVRGRQGNRAWTSADEAEALLRGYRYKVDDIYDKKLISPTAAEKLLKKAAPKHWEKVAELITRPDGKLSVAPISDPRPAESVVATAADFAALAETPE